MSAIQDQARRVAFDEDIVLVDRVLAGDADAFQTLYARYYDKVFAIARGVLLDSEEADDATQEIFTLVHLNLRKFDKRARFSTWIFRVAVNRSIQQARKTKHRKRQVPLDEAAEAPVESHPEPEDDGRISVAMARIQPQDRALLTLFYWDELNLVEIGESLSCSANAAKTRLFRARERFRQAYEEATP